MTLRKLKQAWTEHQRNHIPQPFAVHVWLKVPFNPVWSNPIPSTSLGPTAHAQHRCEDWGLELCRKKRVLWLLWVSVECVRSLWWIFIDVKRRKRKSLKSVFSPPARWRSLDFNKGVPRSFTPSLTPSLCSSSSPLLYFSASSSPSTPGPEHMPESM
jgi:hypothetical protein